MSLKQPTIDRIKAAVNRFKLYLRYTSVGPQSLTQDETKDLVRAGYIGPATQAVAPIMESYIAAHTDALESVATAIPRTIHEGSLAYIDRMATLYADGAATSLGNDVVAILDSHLLPFIDRREGAAIYEVLQDPKNKGKYLGNLLKDKIKNFEHRWQTLVTNEKYRAANHGSRDAVVANNPGLGTHEIIVYKVTRHVDVCKFCLKFWKLDDGITPRLYRLSELESHPSNVGLKQAAWRPCLDTVHPNCKCLLLQLKRGYGFVGGALQYISRDFDALADQRK